jgi:hypothetical protein
MMETMPVTTIDTQGVALTGWALPSTLKVRPSRASA